MASKAKKNAAPKTAAARHRKIMRDSIQGITNPAIKRVARVAGVKTTSRLIYEELRGIIKVNLENIIMDATFVAGYLHVKTIKLNHVITALEVSGIHFVASISHLKNKKTGKHASGAIREIRRAQKASDSLVFPFLSFSRLVREVAQDYGDFRFSKDAIKGIQLAIEDYLIKLLELAQHAAIFAKRTKVGPRDIQFVRRVRDERA